MKNLWKLMTWLVVLGLMTVGIYTPALAEETVDLSKKCSITLDIDKKKEAEGGTFEAYRLASLEVMDGRYMFKDLFGDKTYELDAEFPPKLLEYYNQFLSENEMKAAATASASKGQVKFENLEPGIYLIMETETISNYSVMTPVLIAVPEKDPETKKYVYDREGITKREIKTNPEEESTVPPDDEGDDTIDDDEGTDNEDDYSGDNDDDSSSSRDTLPQTGQLWWPLPLLLCAGLILMLVGRKIRR